MNKKRYTGVADEMLYLSTILSIYYASQLFSITNKYQLSAEIIIDVAKAFYNKYSVELKSAKWFEQRYQNNLELFTIEYVDVKYNIELKHYHQLFLA